MIEVFRTDAQNRCPTDIAAEFARTNWDQPRKVINWQASSYEDDSLCFFQVEDGIACYQIQLWRL